MPGLRLGLGLGLQPKAAVAEEPVSPPTNTGLPAISGNRWVGQTLTVSNGTWDDNGSEISGYTYQWKRGGVDISGATASTHVLVSADAGTNITCQVTATNAAGGTAAGSNTMAICADEFWSSVVLLCGFNGTDAATSSSDESAAGHALTFLGNAQLDTAQFKFGASSLLLDGSGDYLTAPDSDDWTFGAGQFTIEFFVRFNSVGTTISLLAQSDATLGGEGFAIRRQSSELRFTWRATNATNPSLGAAWTPSTGQWYHIAVDRSDSNVLRIYVDGVMLTSTSWATTQGNIAQALRIGAVASGSSPLNGWMDEIRVTKGVARYASDSGFTVPAAAFPRS